MILVRYFPSDLGVNGVYYWGEGGLLGVGAAAHPLHSGTVHKQMPANYTDVTQQTNAARVNVSLGWRLLV